MSNALNMVKGNITNTTDGIHPVANMDIEGKNHYLNALAIMSNIDDKILDVEKIYLKKVIKDLNLPEEKLDEMMKFAENPDSDIIREFMDYFILRDEKYHLLIDCFILAKKDNEYHDKEKELIGYYIQNFKISETEKKLVENLSEIIEKRDVEKVFNLLIDDKELFEKFKPILLPYGLDLVKYHEELKKILDFETEEWEFKGYSKIEDGYKPSTKPVSNRQFIIYLNYLKHTKELQLIQESEQVEDKTIEANFVVDSEDIKFINLNNSDIEFDNGFICKSNKISDSITGIDCEVAEKYSKFVKNILKIDIKPTLIDILKSANFGGDDHDAYYLPTKLATEKKEGFIKDEELAFFRRENKSSKCLLLFSYYVPYPTVSSDTVFVKPVYYANNLTFRLMKKEVQHKSKTNKSITIK